MLERKGEVRTAVLNRASGKLIEASRATSMWCLVLLCISDQWRAYQKVGKDYAHKVINHAEEYVRGNVHTNSIENFWSLLKRGIKGTYVSVEPFHLFRYLDEQSFRFNTRKDNDQGPIHGSPIGMITWEARHNISNYSVVRRGSKPDGYRRQGQREASQDGEGMNLT